MQKNSWDLYWELGLAFCSTQLWTCVLSLTSKKCCHVGIHVILGTWDLGPVWSGKSQLPSSQWLSLQGLTSSKLGLGTHCELGLEYRTWLRSSYRLRLPRKWSNTIIHDGGNVGVVIHSFYNLTCTLQAFFQSKGFGSTNLQQESPNVDTSSPLCR